MQYYLNFYDIQIPINIISATKGSPAIIRADPNDSCDAESPEVEWEIDAVKEYAEIIYALMLRDHSESDLDEMVIEMLDEWHGVMDSMYDIE